MHTMDNIKMTTQALVPSSNLRAAPGAEESLSGGKPIYQTQQQSKQKEK
jgi:hypothetical protein